MTKEMGELFGSAHPVLHHHPHILAMELLGYVERWAAPYYGWGRVYVWDLGSESRPMIANWDHLCVEDICLSGRALRLATESIFFDGKITVFEIPSRTKLYEIQTDLPFARAYDFVCNGGCDKVGLRTEGRVIAFDVTNGQRIYEFEDANELLFSTDDLYVYVKYNNAVAQCDAASGQELKRFQCSAYFTKVSSFLQSPSGTRVIWGENIDEDGEMNDVVVLDSSLGKIMHRFSAKFDSVKGFVTEDSAAVIEDGLVQSFSTETGETIPTAVDMTVIYAAALINGVSTVFDMRDNTIFAADLANGAELFTISLPGTMNRRTTRSIRLSVNNYVGLM
jgi:hypothetical protein